MIFINQKSKQCLTANANAENEGEGVAVLPLKWTPASISAFLPNDCDHCSNPG